RVTPHRRRCAFAVASRGRADRRRGARRRAAHGLAERLPSCAGGAASDRGPPPPARVARRARSRGSRMLLLPGPRACLTSNATLIPAAKGVGGRPQPFFRAQRALGWRGFEAERFGTS